MSDSNPAELDLLTRLARGTTASIPLLGKFLEQAIFGTLEDIDQRGKAAEWRGLFEAVLEEQQKHNATAEQILQALLQQSGMTGEISERLNEVLMAIRRPAAARAGPRQPEAVPTVFISSTIEDLKVYRDAAKEAALGAGFLPVLSQYFPASQHQRALEICQERAVQADVLVVIVGHRYGWVPPDGDNPQEKSITWLECEAAGRAGKENLAFLVDAEFKGLDETKEEGRILEALRQGKDITAGLAAEVQRNTRKLVEFRGWLSDDANKFHRKAFGISENLKYEVRVALDAWRGRQPRFARSTGPGPPPAGDPTRYLQSLRDATATIEIRGLKVGSGAANNYAIEQVYIPLTTVRTTRAAEEELREQRRIELHEALQSPRLVVVGDPGSGKTTFLKRVAFALTQTLLEEEAGAAEKRLGLKDRLFPILIRIGDLAEHMANSRRDPGGRDLPTTDEAPAWVLDFLAARSAASEWGLSRDFFRQKMLDGAAMILLDGLDEAPNRQVRQSVARLFEEAVRAYDKCHFVVTTRPHAYTEQVRLNGFERADIADLDAETIEKSLVRWSEALYSGKQEPAKQHAAELLGALRERPEIRRMVTTPVMLTALAVVHWNERRLPEQRADLYESIIAWLAEQREKRPGRLSPPRCLERLQDLSLAMQQHPQGRQETVPKRWAAQAIGRHFQSHPKHQRIRLAEEFLEEEEIDSGIIVSRGANVTFWHPTFREYLAARAIAGMLDEEQYGLLLKGDTLYRPEWREVVLLFVGALAVVNKSIARVEAFVSRVLESLRPEASLAARARCVGLLGAVIHDLSPLDYQPSDPSYRKTLNAVMDIFESEKYESVRFQDRLEAAEALGQAGDPRLQRDNWVLIPAGSFPMGSEDYDDEKPVHKVYLDAFRIGRHPVTVDEFRKFVTVGGYSDPRWWKHPEHRPEREASEGWDGQLARLNHPVTGVTWFEAAAYCEWLSERTGFRVRLPTEAEWERAACGGKARKYPWGDEDPDASRANYAYKDAPGRTTPVGLYPRGATPEGILDMAGNVWEWVADWYAEDYYRKSPMKNLEGPEEGEARVVRGGSWIYNNPAYLRVSFRNRFGPGLRFVDLGFRCAREVT